MRCPPLVARLFPVPVPVYSPVTVLPLFIVRFLQTLLLPFGRILRADGSRLGRWIIPWLRITERDRLALRHSPGFSLPSRSSILCRYWFGLRCGGRACLHILPSGSLRLPTLKRVSYFYWFRFGTWIFPVTERVANCCYSHRVPYTTCLPFCYYLRTTLTAVCYSVAVSFLPFTTPFWFV
jgi:hypothetical protein